MVRSMIEGRLTKAFSKCLWMLINFPHTRRISGKISVRDAPQPLQSVSIEMAARRWVFWIGAPGRERT
jgi:hypothetical protein